MFELLPDNCIYNDVGKKLLCNVKDFEVLLNGKFIIVPQSYLPPSSDYSIGEYDVDPTT